MICNAIFCDRHPSDFIWSKEELKHKIGKRKRKIAGILTDAQMLLKGQDPLGRPLKREQTDPGTQIPASPPGLGDVYRNQRSRKNFPY